MLPARMIALAVGVAILAVAAPRFAPGVLGLLLGGETEVAQSSAALSPAVAPAIPDDAGSARVRTNPGHVVALRADRDGHFQVDATVNGRSIAMLVDTGATSVALNAETARRLGLYLSRRDFTLPISTANGVVAAAPIRLSEIRVGGIAVRNVPAIVLPGDILDVNLLGMTFLSRLSRFEVADGRLVLTE